MTKEEVSGVPYSGLAAASGLAQFPVCDEVRSEDQASGGWLSPAALLAILTIRVYQKAVPDRFKRKCMYTPSCSRYAVQALRVYGFTGGVKVALERLRRCDGSLMPQSPLSP